MDDSVELRLYETPNGNCPFFTWQKKLSKDAKARIWMYLNRLREGSFAAVKPVGSGVYEIRIHDGPGYRIYLGKRGQEVVILLCGGDKGSQKRDISKAKEYWKQFKSSGGRERAYG